MASIGSTRCMAGVQSINHAISTGSVDFRHLASAVSALSSLSLTCSFHEHLVPAQSCTSLPA